MTPPAAPMDRQTWLLLVLLSVLWGGSFFFAGAALRELPPLTIVLVRVALGGLLLIPFVKLLGGAWPQASLAGWTPFIGMALFNNVIPFSLLIAGQTYITSGMASVLNATAPLFTVLVLAGFGDESLSARRVAGVIIGLIGVAVLHGIDVAHTQGQTIGLLLCLGGGLSYGFAGLWARRRLNGIPPITSATCQLMVSTVIMAIIAGAHDRPWTLPIPGLATIGALVGLAALATSLAYIVFFTILARAGASNVVLVTLLIPITAILLGVLILGEPLTATGIAGALIIAASLVVIDGRALSWALQKAGPLNPARPERTALAANDEGIAPSESPAISTPSSTAYPRSFVGVSKER